MSEVNVETRIDKKIDAATCRHHWVIEQPNGPTSLGRCKLCGQKREFSNNPESVLIPPESRGGPRPERQND